MAHRGTSSTLALAGLTLAAVALAGCSRSDSVESTVADSTTTTSTTSTSTTTTVPPTSTSSTTSTTTTTSTTSTSTTTTSTTTTVPTPPPPDAPSTAFVTDDLALREIDVATGATVRVVVDAFTGDGVFRGNLRLAPDRSAIWFSEGYEDGWYGCDSSVGSFGRVDLESGSVELLGTGTGAEPSPDGASLAYVGSDLCLPDPENPDLWVLTPYDRVVLRDLATGDEQEFATDPAPDGYDSPSAVAWTGFTPGGELLVTTNDGVLRRIDPAGPGSLQDHPVVLPEIRGDPVGATAGGLVTVEYGDEGSADVYLVDLTSGEARLLATSDGFVTVGIAPTGAVAISGFTGVSVQPDAPVAVLTPPDGATYYDLDW